jgi:hypothetical protein
MIKMFMHHAKSANARARLRNKKPLFYMSAPSSFPLKIVIHHKLELSADIKPGKREYEAV